MTRYDELSQKEKQLLAAQYPYKKDADVFNNPSKQGNDIIHTQDELIEFKKKQKKMAFL